MAEEKSKAAKAAPDKKVKVDISNLAKQLVGLTVLEVNQLGEILKNEHGIEPAAASAVVAAPAAAASESEAGPEKSSFDVILKDPGEQKVAVIKAVKELTGIGLGEAKAIIDEAPKPVKTGVNKDEAESIKKTLEAAGAVAEIV